MVERDWAKEYAAKLRKELRAAVKGGVLPVGSSVRVRKVTASLMTAVEADVDTHNPSAYFDMEGRYGLTGPGRELASVLNSIVEPYKDEHDDKSGFVQIRLDGRQFSPFL